MTEEKKRPNGEVAKEICKEVYEKRWPVSLELSIKQALDEKDKEIARLNGLLERRTEALRRIVDPSEMNPFSVARQALQDDGKEKI